ncbi:hypothetical protein CL622_07075 [archaeon]|nr:hypothetical protein [archaeon]
MDLSVVIVNYGQVGLVKQCLKGIRNAGWQFYFEVFVVMNGPDDGCAQMVSQEFPRVKTLHTKGTIGLGEANNMGIKSSIGKHILILNPDVAIESRVIENMIDYLDNNLEVGLVAPKLLNPDQSLQHSTYRFPNLFTPLYRRTWLGKTKAGRKGLASYLMTDWDHGANRSVDWLLGACLLIRRQDLNQVGDFDKRFKLYFEDVDLCRRFWEQNKKVVYLADINLVHYHHRESAKWSLLRSLFSRVTWLHLASAVKYFWKYRGKSARQAASPPVI